MPKYFYNQRRNSRPGEGSNRTPGPQGDRRASNSPPRGAQRDSSTLLEPDVLDTEVQTIIQAVLKQLNRTRMEAPQRPALQPPTRTEPRLSLETLKIQDPGSP